MISRSRPQCLDVTFFTSSHASGYPRETPLEPGTEWLLQHHIGFCRGWGRGWAWRDRRGAALALGGSVTDPEGGFGAPLVELSASVAAARHLAARTRGGRAAIVARDGREGAAASLLPPTMVACSEDVSRCIATLLELRGEVPERLLFATCTLLAEAAQNVCEHSGSFGCVAVSWTPGVGGREGAFGIGVADRGIGISGSLVPRFRQRDLAAPGPERAIVSALKLDDWSGRARGAGLCMSRQLLSRHGGVLHVRSGGAVVSVGPDGVLLASRSPGRLAAVPGTQIAIYLGTAEGCSVVDTGGKRA
jgi:hypothetical protein